MTILVTGGAGFVGTNLVKRLIKEGHKVISVDNYSSGTRDNHQEGCHYLTSDVRNKHFVWAPKEKVDVIYHLAAMSRIQPSITDPTHAIKNNCIGTLNVLEWARKIGAKVIYAGSSSKHHGLYESPYAWSKYTGEELCMLYRYVYKVDTVVCRFYNVYGDYQIEEGDYSTVVGIFLNQFRNGKELTIVGDGEQRRDFTHVDDIVDGLYRCKSIDWQKMETFELGSGKNYSINEVADMFGKYPRKYIPARAGEYPYTLCEELDRNWRKLGWRPTGDLKKYIFDEKSAILG